MDPAPVNVTKRNSGHHRAWKGKQIIAFPVLVWCCYNWAYAHILLWNKGGLYHALLWEIDGPKGSDLWKEKSYFSWERTKKKGKSIRKIKREQREGKRERSGKKCLKANIRSCMCKCLCLSWGTACPLGTPNTRDASSPPPLVLAGKAGTSAWYHHGGLLSVSTATSHTSWAPAHPFQQFLLLPNFTWLSERDCGMRGRLQGKQNKLRSWCFIKDLWRGFKSLHTSSKQRKEKNERLKQPRHTQVSRLHGWMKQSRIKTSLPSCRRLHRLTHREKAGVESTRILSYVAHSKQSLILHFTVCFQNTETEPIWPTLKAQEKGWKRRLSTSRKQRQNSALHHEN